MPMRNMSKTDSGCGASCAATSPETIAAGVGRDGSYVVTDAPRATGRRSMGTIVQQPPGALPVVARLLSGRRVACPPARRPRRELRSARRLEARPGPAGPAAASNRALALPPPSGTAARPCRPRGGLQSSGAWCACPGPAAAHRHRGLAPQAPRRPPIGRGLVRVCLPWPCRRIPRGVCGECGRIRIGCRYPDRLLSYPDLRYLSGCLLPIRMRCSLGSAASGRAYAGAARQFRT